MLGELVETRYRYRQGLGRTRRPGILSIFEPQRQGAASVIRRGIITETPAHVKGTHSQPTGDTAVMVVKPEVGSEITLLPWGSRCPCPSAWLTLKNRFSVADKSGEYLIGLKKNRHRNRLFSLCWFLCQTIRVVSTTRSRILRGELFVAQRPSSSRATFFVASVRQGDEPVSHGFDE